MRVKSLRRFFTVLAVLALAPPGSTPAQSVHDARTEALRLYDAGRYQEALPLFNRVLERKHRDIESLNKRGCIYVRMNQPARAIADFDAATNASPLIPSDQLYPSAFTNRGIALMMLGRDDEALSDFRRSISIRLAYPENPISPYYKKWRIGMASAYGGMGHVYHRQGEANQSLVAYDQAIRYNPDDPIGHIGRGLALVGTGRFDDAMASYNTALRIDPNNARIYGYLGAAMERLGQNARALANYDSSIRLDPNLPTTRRIRAALLSRLDRGSEAVTDLDEAIRLDPKNASAFKDRGGVYNRLGDHERALRDLDEAIRLDPKNARAYQNRAATHNGMGRYDRALADSDEALKLDPKNAGALNNRGLALAGLGHYERAISDLTEAIRLDPVQVAPYFNRGGAFAHLGQFVDAQSDYEEVLHRVPGYAPAEAGLSQVRQIVRNHPRSVRDDWALRHDPEEAERYREQGNLKRQEGDWSGAITEYTRALEIDPKDADAYGSRGWSRAIAGEPGVEADVHAWFELKGWRDPFAPYVALLGVLAERQAGHESAASAMLDEALANTQPPSWPAPLFRYLKRTVTSSSLLASADTPEKMTEARAVIGLDLLGRGERSAAIEHLQWVQDHGVKHSIAKDLAHEALRRAEPTPPAAPPDPGPFAPP